MYGHSVSRFVEPLLLHSDRDKIRFGVFQPTRCDEITGRLDLMAGLWSEIFRLLTRWRSRKSANQQLDIMIDLAGHMPMNRSCLLYHRPAVITMKPSGIPSNRILGHRLPHRGLDHRSAGRKDNSLPKNSFGSTLLPLLHARGRAAPDRADRSGGVPGRSPSAASTTWQKFSPGLLDLGPDSQADARVPAAARGFAFSDASTRNHIAREFGRREIEPERGNDGHGSPSHASISPPTAACVRRA